MRTMIAIAFGFGLVAFGAAHAMPVAPAPADGIMLVRDGCGPKMARNSKGQCRPASRVTPCPDGMRRDIMGKCISRTKTAELGVIRR